MFEMASKIGGKAGDALSAAANKTSAFVKDHRPDYHQMDQAKAWIKKTASDTAVEATRLGQEAMNSDMAKDMAKGAAAGAVLAVPVPLIGPALGAAVGAGIGVYANMKRSKTDGPPQVIKEAATPPSKDLYAELLKLDDLLKKGVSTQSEFDIQKAKLLGR
jgi:hypothetical protein